MAAPRASSAHHGQVRGLQRERPENGEEIDMTRAGWFGVYRAALIALASIAFAPSAEATTIVVVERGDQSVTAIDLDDPTTHRTLASGFSGTDLLDVAYLPNGNVLVSNRGGAGRLYEIDPVAGGIVSTETLGFLPNHLFVESDGTLVIASWNSGVFRRAAGETVFTRIATVTGDLTGLARLGDDYLLTSAGGSVYRIDPDGPLGSNVTTLFSNFGEAHALAAIGDGDMLLTRYGAGDVLRLSGLRPGETPTFSTAYQGLPTASGIVPDGLGGYFVTLQSGAGTVVRLLPDGTGVATVATGLNGPKGIAILGVLKTGEELPLPAVPEPASLALVATGAAALATVRRRAPRGATSG